MNQIDRDKLIEWIDEKMKSNTGSYQRSYLKEFKDFVLSLPTNTESREVFGYVYGGFFHKPNSISLSEEMKSKATPVYDNSSLLSEKNKENEDLTQCCDEYANTIKGLREEIEELKNLISVKQKVSEQVDLEYNKLVIERDELKSLLSSSHTPPDKLFDAIAMARKDTSISAKEIIHKIRSTIPAADE